jgi:hypothetical protein
LWAQLPAGVEKTQNDSLNKRDKDSLKQGAWIEYFPGGGTKEETIFKKGRKNGLYLAYFRWPNCFKEEANYKNDTLDGYKIEYYRNCKIKLVQTFHNGIKDGYEKKYNLRGTLIQEAVYEKDKIKKIRNIEEKVLPHAKKKEDKSLGGYLTGEKKPGDSSVMQILSRLNLSANTLLVADVTGSMYKYIGELLIWYKACLDSTPLERFTFFNDGDRKLTYQKEIGKTGGIYSIQTKSIEKLKDKMEEAINNGDGGDLPENNIEGILKGTKKFRHTDQVVMIADKLSGVKDISLLKKVKAPVRVILCGNRNYINCQYLDIAYQTKGSIEKLNGSVKEELWAIKEDGIINVDGLEFQLKRGKFRRVNIRKNVE